MVRLVSCAVFGCLAEGARLSSLTDEDLGTFAMLETISTAGGMMDVTFGGQLNPACESRIWDPKLSSSFANRRVVGSGATACVWLGEDSTGTTVAIKVGKNSGGKAAGAALASWSAECRDMQLLRFDACKGGKDILALHEMFMPTCTGVGPTSNGGAYYIMHAAGIVGFKVASEQSWDTAVRKELFASFVASLHAMHTVGQTHNDLHGDNIVVDGKNNMALIDFGELKAPEKSWVTGYKRDGNAVWRWAEVLAECPQGELWATSFDQGYLMPAVASATKSCLKAKWGVDAQFISALDDIMDKGMDEKLPHGISKLFETKFIQSNMPLLERKYPAEFAEGCLDWSAAKMKEMMLRKQFEDHVKCDTVPTFEWTKTSTKKGKTRTRQVQQCGGLVAGCFTLEKSDGKANVWQCEGASITRGSNCGEFGSCLTDLHEAYAYTKAWEQ